MHLRASSLSLLFLSLAIALCAAPGHGQGGYRTREIEEFGIKYDEPRDYIPIITTNDEWVMLRYKEKLPEREKDRKKVWPELELIRIPWIPEEGPVTGFGASDPDSEGEAAEEEEVAEGDGDQEAPEKPINSAERWLERYRRNYELVRPEPGKERGGVEATEYELVRSKGGARGYRRWAYVHSKRQGPTVLWIGECHEEDWKEQTKIWRTMAESARFSEAEPRDMSKWDRFYARKPEYVDPGYRIEVRRKIFKGLGDWEVDDTENYLFVYNTKDEKLMRIVKRELEAIREAYVERFPPVEPVTAVSTVIICKDRDIYFAYGGPSGSGGYWSSADEQLVFYDYENVKGEAGTGRANSRIVLYHEAFHQYIYYSVGELAPHSWYNEGTGDYFSGADISGGKVKKIGVNPWRIEYIQRVIERGNSVPWEDIIEYSQRQYYANAGLCYAQGWSMIYFLRTDKDALRHPVWSGILPTYFDVLKDEYALEVEKLDSEKLDSEELTDEQKWTAGEAARERAVSAAFADVDFRALEAAWKEFTLDLKVPK